MEAVNDRISMLDAGLVVQAVLLVGLLFFGFAAKLGFPGLNESLGRFFVLCVFVQNEDKL